MQKSGIVKTLERRPTLVFETTEDAQCIELFTELGIISCFKRSSTPHFSLITSAVHKTHWVLGACWSGHSQPGDNGYTAYCFPKAQFSIELVRDYAKHLLHSVGGVVTDYLEVKVDPSSQPNRPSESSI